MMNLRLSICRHTPHEPTHPTPPHPISSSESPHTSTQFNPRNPLTLSAPQSHRNPRNPALSITLTLAHCIPLADAPLPPRPPCLLPHPPSPLAPCLLCQIRISAKALFCIYLREVRLAKRQYKECSVKLTQQKAAYEAASKQCWLVEHQLGAMRQAAQTAAEEANGTIEKLDADLTAQRTLGGTLQENLDTERTCYEQLARLLMLSQARLRSYEVAFGTIATAPSAHPPGSKLLIRLDPADYARCSAPNRVKMLAKLEQELDALCTCRAPGACASMCPSTCPLKHAREHVNARALLVCQDAHPYNSPVPCRFTPPLHPYCACAMGGCCCRRAVAREDSHRSRQGSLHASLDTRPVSPLERPASIPTAPSVHRCQVPRCQVPRCQVCRCLVVAAPPCYYGLPTGHAARASRGASERSAPPATWCKSRANGRHATAACAT